MLYSEIILLIPIQIKAIYSQPCFQIALLTKVLHKAQQSVVIYVLLLPHTLKPFWMILVALIQMLVCLMN